MYVCMCAKCMYVSMCASEFTHKPIKRACVYRWEGRGL